MQSSARVISCLHHETDQARDVHDDLLMVGWQGSEVLRTGRVDD